jgi:hypothetical protein
VAAVLRTLVEVVNEWSARPATTRPSRSAREQGRLRPPRPPRCNGCGIGGYGGPKAIRHSLTVAALFWASSQARNCFGVVVHKGRKFLTHPESIPCRFQKCVSLDLGLSSDRTWLRLLKSTPTSAGAVPGTESKPIKANQSHWANPTGASKISDFSRRLASFCQIRFPHSELRPEGRGPKGPASPLGHLGLAFSGGAGLRPGLRPALRIEDPRSR